MANTAVEKNESKYVSSFKPRKMNAFDTLVGFESAKQDVEDFFDISIAAYEDPESIKLYRLKPAKGILLYGPPGVGKTAFARACANYFELKFYETKGSEWIAGCSLVGEPQAKIKKTFSQARKLAPCILFFDEIDAIAQRRNGSSNNSPSDLILNNFLAEIDGYNPSSGIFIIAATNRKDILDPALLRPGRLEKHIEIGLPGFEARCKILKVHLRNRPVEKIDLGILGEITEGQSGAFLEAVVNRAATAAWRDRRRISQKDLFNAIKQLLEY